MLESNDRIKGETTDHRNKGIDIIFENIRYEVEVEVEGDGAKCACCKQK